MNYLQNFLRVCVTNVDFSSIQKNYFSFNIYINVAIDTQRNSLADLPREWAASRFTWDWLALGAGVAVCRKPLSLTTRP